MRDRGLEHEPHVPWKVDPGVLAHLGDEGVDQRPPGGFGVHGRVMAFGHHLADQPRGLAGVDQVVDHQDRRALPAGKIDDRAADRLQHLEAALLPVVVVGGDADRLDQTNAELARDDRRRHQPAARDADDRLPRALPGKPPRQRAGIAVELVPGDRKRLVRARLSHQQSPSPEVILVSDDGTAAPARPAAPQEKWVGRRLDGCAASGKAGSGAGRDRRGSRERSMPAVGDWPVPVAAHCPEAMRCWPEP